MIKEIVKDPLFLSLKSTEATLVDLSIVQDLLDTIEANKERCVGMAANMIGYNKKIVVVNHNGKWLIMINPVVLNKMGNKYTTEEGCLSLSGVRKTERYQKIQVEYLTVDWKKKIQTLTGYSAQILQHELDHLEGILI